MEQLAVEHFRDHQLIQSVAIEAVECVGRLIDLSSGLKIIAVVGCGPNPPAVQRLLEAGYNAVGVEPVPGFWKQKNQHEYRPRGAGGRALSLSRGRGVEDAEKMRGSGEGRCYRIATTA